MCDTNFKEEDIGEYTCRFVDEEIAIDGKLDEQCWKRAPKSPRFVDMVTGEPGFMDTRMAALWDERYLYVGYWIAEPNVRAELTERDSQIYHENDVELFIGGKDCYYEFQINALGTIYEVFYIWQDAYLSGGFANHPEFSLTGENVDVLGGFQDVSRYKKHPRGRRWAFMNWDFPGLKTAVHVDGKLNDSSVVDKGWTVELAFPWEGMRALDPQRRLPPAEGDTWRFDFSRFELLSYNGQTADTSPGWSFNKHSAYDSHLPECFTKVHFSRDPV